MVASREVKSRLRLWGLELELVLILPRSSNAWWMNFSQSDFTALKNINGGKHYCSENRLEYLLVRLLFTCVFHLPSFPCSVWISWAVFASIKQAKKICSSTFEGKLRVCITSSCSCVKFNTECLKLKILLKRTWAATCQNMPVRRFIGGKIKPVLYFWWQNLEMPHLQ